MEFDIEKELVQRGFSLDFEKDERSTYKDGNLFATLHWDGDMIDDEGQCISMTIQYLRAFEESRTIYFGRRPTTKGEFDTLFNLLGV